MGQCFMMGWEGTEITSQIRTLIEDHHIGAVLLTTKNLKGIWWLSFLCLSLLFWRFAFARWLDISPSL
jgi:hypothetical protein